jgi:hypothetical protein
MFQQLGAGSFAVASVDDARGNVVVKQVRDWRDGDVLSREFHLLTKAYNRCRDEPEPMFSLPKPLGLYDNPHDFVTRSDLNSANQSDNPQPAAGSGSIVKHLGLGPRALYAMSRAWPLPPQFSARVCREHFPPPFNDDEGRPPEPFIARLYLGRDARTTEPEPRVSPSRRFYNSSNFPLDAAAVRSLFGTTMSMAIARSIGNMLGRLNFIAETDARDVEFVACGDDRDPWRPEPSFACIDFNQCRPLDLSTVEAAAAAIVASVKANDPYYPLQQCAEWYAFSDGYIRAAAMPGAAALAPLIADAVLSLLYTW